MNKKQKNRKIVAQNKRNRMINRRYTTTIKTLSKLFTKQIKTLNSSSKTNLDLIETTGTLEKKQLLTKIQNHLYSAFDKAVKKGIVHKNNASRKKSRLHFLSKTVNL